jgi:Ca2+-transporting ATPase
MARLSHPMSQTLSSQANVPWHRIPLAEVWERLSSQSNGLSSAEAARRLTVQGPNQLPEGKQVRPLLILASQFKGLLIWVLLVAGAVSAFLGEAFDSLAIFAIVGLNALIGFYQEFQAEKSLAALKQLTSPKAKVWRDGKIMSLPVKDIVTGDILALEPGDLVAADGRLIKSASLRCVESALTGESEAVNKQPGTFDKTDIPLGDRTNMVFMGTSVAVGTATAIVVGTGLSTELGRIAGLLENASLEGKTPLQEKLNAFGRILVCATLGIVALLFALGYWRGTAPLELFLTSVSLAVAAVPEGLPAVVTVSLALGVSRMSRRAALVRKLPAVETLGATTVICTDKTGTLTLGEMTVRKLYVGEQVFDVTGEGYGPGGEIRIGGKTPDQDSAEMLKVLGTGLLACNNSHLVFEREKWRVVGDPTEGALLAAGLKSGVTLEQVEQCFLKVEDFPFDSDRKRSSVVRRSPKGERRAFVNGAPDLLLPLCTQIFRRGGGVRGLTDNDRKEIAGHNAEMARRGLRVLGSAYRDIDEVGSVETVERELVFVGLVGMYDPPRPEAKKAIATCQAAGIRVAMITGDHPHTASAIAAELDLPIKAGGTLTGIELDAMSDRDLSKRVTHTTVFARVTAEHKLRIVRALKANNAIVAMTGDGVNDAPAMKGADIGIAMGLTGTEVTKQAADMVITDDNFSTIVAAVEEGRGIFDNIRKTLLYLLAGNTAELLVMTLAVITGVPAPLVPIHLLWINLVTDGFPALCLATDPIEPDVMQHPPRHPSEQIMNSEFLKTMLFSGIIEAGLAFGVYLSVLKTRGVDMARTEAFTVIVFSELLRSFGNRNREKPLWRIPFLSNLPLILVVLVSVGIQVMSHHNNLLGRFLKSTSLSISDTLTLFFLALIPLFCLELLKLLKNKGKNHATAQRSEPD